MYLKDVPVGSPVRLGSRIMEVVRHGEMGTVVRPVGKQQKQVNQRVLDPETQSEITRTVVFHATPKSTVLAGMTEVEMV